MLASKFSTVYHKVWQSPQEWQGKSPSSLKKIPKYTLLLLCRWNFVCVFIIRFCRTFAVFYTGKIVYICVFMNCFTSCCLCNILMNPWNIYMCVCVCVCIQHTHTQSGQNCCWQEGKTYPAQQWKVCAAHKKRIVNCVLLDLKIVLFSEISVNYELPDSVCAVSSLLVLKGLIYTGTL